MSTLRLRRLPHAAVFAAFLTLCGGGVQADSPPAVQASPPRPASLFEALTIMPVASVNDGSVVLTVQPG